jgi:hypothetical protein
MIEVTEILKIKDDGTYETQPVILNPKTIVFIHPDTRGGSVINMGTAECWVANDYDAIFLHLKTQTI